MKNDNKVSQDQKNNLPDKETKEILEEMDKDGIKDVGLESDLSDDDKDKKKDIKSTPSKDEEEENKKNELKEKLDELEIEYEDDASNEDLENLLEENKSNKDNIHMMPVKKHTDQVKKLKKEFDEKIQGLEKDLQTAKQQAGDKDISKKLESLAEKYNTEPDFVKDLYEMLKSDSGIPSDLQKKIDYIDQKAEQENQNQQFNDDFDKNVLSLIEEEYPDATQSQIDGIKQKVHEHAFSKKYQHTPLELIYGGLKEFRDFFEDSKSKKTAEKGGKRTKGTKVLDFENMTDAEAAKLSDEDFDKYSEYKEKQSGSHLKVTHHY